MKDIKQVYHNDFGISYYWKKDQALLTDRVQLVFKEMGFYFTIEEIKYFCQLVQWSRAEKSCCRTCDQNDSCHKFLLKTPYETVDLAVSMYELQCIDDLLRGTLFTIELNLFIETVGRN